MRDWTGIKDAKVREKIFVVHEYHKHFKYAYLAIYNFDTLIYHISTCLEAIKEDIVVKRITH